MNLIEFVKILHINIEGFSKVHFKNGETLNSWYSRRKEVELKLTLLNYIKEVVEDD
ncbi:MAG: hypothetical protein ACRCX2_27870 [Paraclostridium sp.]